MKPASSHHPAARPGMHFPLDAETLHRFSHPAMATLFEIFIRHDDRDYAAQAALAAFELLDTLEQDLSRFIENSDMARIRRMQPGQVLRLGLPAFSCLQQCQELHRQTGGAFDPTVGALVRCWLDAQNAGNEPAPQALDAARQRLGLSRLRLNAADFTVALLEAPAPDLDLGGFGKGFALDEMAALLREWDIEQALLHGGHSSVLVLGDAGDGSGWPVALRHPQQPERVLAVLPLRDAALSSSGLEKGRHIIDPRTAAPVAEHVATWAMAESAARSDALSTAFMVMHEAEIVAFCQAHADVAALVICENGQARHFGAWPEGVA